MHRKLILTAFVLLVLAAPAAAQVHFARPTRDDAAVELAARPQPDSWTIHDLLSGGPITLPGYPECNAWFSEPIDTFGAVGFTVQLDATGAGPYCLLQSRINDAPWADINPSAVPPFGNGIHSFRDSGQRAGLGTSIRVYCYAFSCAQSAPPTELTTALVVVKR